MSYFSKYWFDFVLVITQKEIKARYKRVIFGFLWAILNPILQMLVMGFLFRFFIPVKIDNYFYFLFAGLLPWNFFSQTLSKCTPIFLNERSLIQKAKFPREALVLSIVFSNLFHFFISLFLLLTVTVFVGYLSLFKMVVLVLVIIWLCLFTIGISLFSSTLFVKYRDVKFILQAIIPLWFYLTPIMYTRSLLPETISKIILLNPMTGIIEIFQFVFSSTETISSLMFVVPGLFVSLAIFVYGIYLFIKDNMYFDDWL